MDKPCVACDAYVALGSNLDDPQRQLQSGFAAIARLPQTQLVARSSLYASAPVGYADQPDFVNAVAAIRTSLTPRALLDALLAIERVHGRVREFPNAPRTLDLDLVLYGERVVHEPGLSVPHPRMLQRAFVLAPLAEIAPDAVVPGPGRAPARVRDLLAGIDLASVRVLKEVAA
jgi:2-amino-4-hydroxy-6-hydroxymethyldihydropteridine diphosphokinase